MDEFARTIGVMAGALAKRAGRGPDDLAVRTLAGAVIGVIMAGAIVVARAATEAPLWSWGGPRKRAPGAGQNREC
jgi:hypothetical protein